MIKKLFYLYLHGGPGFSSKRESQVFLPMFQKSGKNIVFWNEPSRLRPDAFRQYETSGLDPWQRSIASVKDCIAREIPEEYGIHIIAHSFAVHLLSELYSDVGQRLRGITMITPVFYQDRSHERIIRLAIQDYLLQDQEKAKELKALLSQHRSFFDAPMKKAMSIALMDEKLLSHYWQDQDVMIAALNVMQSPSYQFDPESFFGVLDAMDYENIPPQLSSSITIPTCVIFGQEDPVVDQPLEVDYINKNYSNCQFSYFNHCGHWPHLEKPEAFFDLV